MLEEEEKGMTKKREGELKKKVKKEEGEDEE